MKLSKELSKKLQDDKWAPVMGNPDGKAVIYEFFDYNCGHCKNEYEVLRELIEKNKDVKIVLKNFPVFPLSQIPARAGIASAMQGKAFLLHKELFQNILLPVDYENMTIEMVNKKIVEKILSLARKIGLDEQKLKQDMIATNVDDEINSTRQIAHELDIHGTPSLIINKTVFHGFMELEEILKQI